MLQASFLDCLFLDFLSQFQDFCAVRKAIPDTQGCIMYASGKPE